MSPLGLDSWGVKSRLASPNIEFWDAKNSLAELWDVKSPLEFLKIELWDAKSPLEPLKIESWDAESPLEPLE